MTLAARDRKPLYRLLADEIRKGIKAGEWLPGDRLPSEPDLARRFAVSRATVREAMRALEQEGVVRAQRGNGTFVAPPGQTLCVGIDSLYSITDAIRMQGQEPGTTDASFRTIALTAELAQQLELPPDSGETAELIERTRLADGHPVALSRDIVPTRYLTAPGWRERVSAGSLFKVLIEQGVDLSHACTNLSAVEAPEAVAARLGVQPGKPLLLTRELVHDRAGRPVCLSEDFYRTDRIEVSLMRRRSG